jgi:ribosomal protein S18 acetylase RimI-like enzyme
LVGEIDTIAVDPLWWRFGIGRKLMTNAIEHLTHDGYREAVLWTLANHERGQRFYEATGWKVDGHERDQGRQIRYHRRIASPH